MSLLWENENTLYSDFNELIEEVENKSINPTNVVIEINDETVIAYRPAPDYPQDESTISRDGENQWLVEAEMEPSYVLQKLLSHKGFQTKHSCF